MSRPTNVPFHQNVRDLLDLGVGICPEAGRMIAEHEAAYGPLPAAVRDWYLIPNVVVREWPAGDWLARMYGQAGTLWWALSNDDPSIPLAVVLANYARLVRGESPPEGEPTGEYLEVKRENQGNCNWWLALDGTDDPPVVRDSAHQSVDLFEWQRQANHFSEFVWRWVWYYHSVAYPARSRPLTTFVRQHKPNAFAHWLCSSAHSYPAPVIDFLTEQLGEPTLHTLADRPAPGVVQLTYTTDSGLVRLTTDRLDHHNPHAAWWVSGDTREEYERLCDLLRPWSCFAQRVYSSDMQPSLWPTVPPDEPL